MSDDGLPPETRVGRVTLRVTDLDRMADFYERVVGLHVQSREETQVTLGAGGDPLLELVASDAPERPLDEAGLFHMAFLLPDRQALGAAVQRVSKRWLLDGASDHLVSEALYLVDPEDNGIELYCDKPRAEWPVQDDGTVEMDSLPLDLDALAADGDGTKAVPDETTVGHVHLEVSSIPDAERFYVDTLGFGTRNRWGDSALFVAAGDYHHHVGLNTWNECTDPVSSRGLDSWELIVPDGATLDAIRDRLTAADYAFETTDDEVTVTDEDGIRLRIRVE